MTLCISESTERPLPLLRSFFLSFKLEAEKVLRRARILGRGSLRLCLGC